jgi:exodeoxyribonuclease III
MWGGRKTTDTSAASSTTVSTPVPKELFVEKIALELDDKRFSGEGRTITVEFPSFTLVACYVPNSGSALERLSYRTEEWDVYMREYLCRLRERKPVVFCGDLNVGHLDLDIHNPTAKHIATQSGLTPQERSSFQTLLDTGFVDAFRHLYPNANGQFTWWSMRSNARPVNKGLRLDYFVCSNDMVPKEDSEKAEIFDSFILHEETVGLSDHCPIMLVVKVP